MTIQQQLEKLNETFKQLHNSFIAADKDKQLLDEKYRQKSASAEQTRNDEVNRISQIKEDVLKYYRIAKDNSPKELISSGIAPQKPDLAKLNQMVLQIDESSRNDPTAARIIDLSSAYCIYLDNQIKDVSSKKQADFSRIDTQKNTEASALADRKKGILKQCRDYLTGPEIRNLVRLFENIHDDYEITEEVFRESAKAKKRKRMMLLGYSQYKVDVPSRLSCLLKNSLGEHFDEAGKTVNCPCGFTTDSHEEIIVEYTDLNENLMKMGIQALILNYLRYFGPREVKISVFDYLHYNADILGPLFAIASGKNSVIEAIPANEKDLKDSKALLASYYRNVENRIRTSNVYEYNRTCTPEERIPLRIVIINKESEVFRSNEDADLLYVLNNAAKFGITVIKLVKNTDGGSKGKDREKQYLSKAADHIRVISDSSGQFYIENNTEWMKFKWLKSPSSIPSDYADRIRNLSRPAEIGTKLFKRYPMTIPEKSAGRRKAISIPFAIDENDQPVNCTFENETFAAYLMGAAGSGKSTLLHTIICGLLMNYHPDEVELWLLDFKMLEFKRYVDHMPPHVKYILLEKSEDLVFDIIDKLTELLDERQYIFSQNGWSKLTDVPVEKNIPAVFVIIDEFAQMSQILKESKGSGYGSDYTIKLENLLAKGRALGLKFIFASQTYTTGISGLTETACKQIQLRFAMKNSPDEIKQTLTLSTDEITPEISSWISSLPAYETLFKWRNANDEVKVGRFKNMYTEGDEIETLISKIRSVYKAVPAGAGTDSSSYIDKHPVAIDGREPKTFKSQVPLIRQYEKETDLSSLEDSDVLVYAGVPCSFNPVRPFTVINGISENMLVVGGGREREVSVMLSLFNSFSMRKVSVEIWSHERSPLFKRYKDSVLSRYKKITDLDEICRSIHAAKKNVETRKSDSRLVVVLGYELLANEMEILGDGRDGSSIVPGNEIEFSGEPDLTTLLEKMEQCGSQEEKDRLIAEYNSGVAQHNEMSSGSSESPESIYDARSDMEWILRRSPNYGTHFLFCFEQSRDFLNTKLDERNFQHKLLFSMSRDDSLSICGNRKANELDDGVLLYTDGKDSFTLRPHLYRGVPCEGWQVDDDGKVVKKRG